MSQNNTFAPINGPFGRRNGFQFRDGMDNRRLSISSKFVEHSHAAIGAPGASHQQSRQHVEWFDYAKGICIALVVMMHSTLGVEKLYGAEGFMHYIVTFAAPFRMPDFFFLSALFLPLAMPRSWLHYFDKKVLHFAYFYAMWLVILVVFKAAGKGELNVETVATHIYEAIIGPYPTLWFIYILPLFFIVTKLLKGLSGYVLFAFAAMLQIASIHTGWGAIDEFAAHYYVYFVAGYLLSPYAFQLAGNVRENKLEAVYVLIVWALVNGILAFSPSPLAAWPTLASLPIVSIVLGLSGAIAIILIASLMAIFDVGRFIRFCGQNSIVLYLSFTIPMAITRLVLAKLNLIQDVGLVSLIVWLAALTTPLLVFVVLRHTPLRFLYARPDVIALPYQTVRNSTKRPVQVSVIVEAMHEKAISAVGLGVLKPRSFA